MQPVGNGLQQIVAGGEESRRGGGVIVPMDVVEHKPHPSRPNHTHQQFLQQSREMESPTPQDFVIGQGSHVLSKEDQAVFLRAHSAACADAHSSEATPSSARGGDNQTPHTGSNFIPTLTKIPSSQYAPLDATPLPAPVLEYHPSLTEPGAASLHEVTQVTNSLLAPISSLPPLPQGSNDGSGGSTPTPYKKELNRR